jgi:hypothetical protein
VRGLAGALLAMWLEAETVPGHGKDPLVLGLQDGPSLAGVLLLHLLRGPGLSRRRRVDLLRGLQPAAGGGPEETLLERLFPSAARRETFRLAVGRLAAEAGLLGSTDSELVLALYGRLLGKRLFPRGPGGEQPEEPVRHQNSGPWTAERERCRRLEEGRGQQAEETPAEEERFSTEVVALHDELTRVMLTEESRTEGRAQAVALTWTRQADWQTAPLGSWHCPASQPRSLLLENVCGTSGLFSRLRRGHAGIVGSMFFLAGDEARAQAPAACFLQPPAAAPHRALSLADRLGGLEQVVTVEPAHQVTATSRTAGELVVTAEQVCFVAEGASWSVAVASIDSVARRRLHLQEVALELFLASGEAHLLLALTSSAAREAPLVVLQRQGVASPAPSQALAQASKLWRQGGTTNGGEGRGRVWDGLEHGGEQLLTLAGVPCVLVAEASGGAVDSSPEKLVLQDPSWDQVLLAYLKRAGQYDSVPRDQHGKLVEGRR